MNKSGPNVNSKENMINNINCKSPLGQNNNIDPASGYCEFDPLNQNNVDNAKQSWFSDTQDKKTNLGKENNCDPMQTGQIMND